MKSRVTSTGCCRCCKEGSGQGLWQEGSRQEAGRDRHSCRAHKDCGGHSSRAGNPSISWGQRSYPGPTSQRDRDPCHASCGGDCACHLMFAVILIIFPCIVYLDLPACSAHHYYALTAGLEDSLVGMKGLDPTGLSDIQVLQGLRRLCK